MTTTAQIASGSGVRIAYETRGGGEPVLLIHGLGYTREGWGPAFDLLAEDFLVIAFDNRGIGGSDTPPGPYTAAAMAEDAVAVLDAAGVRSAHVVGTSLGGMVAQELALGHPARVRKLVLVSTTPGGRGAYALPERTLKLLEEMPTLPPEIALRRAVENALSAQALAERPELADEIYAYRLAHPIRLEGWQAQAAAGTAFDGFDRLDAVAAPTLVLHGTADNVVDPRSSEPLAERIPGARVELVEDGGHLFFWEEPERFAATVRAFLQEDA